MPTPMVLFDDDSPWLSPLNDLRGSFMVRTGALTTLERWTALGPGVGLEVVGVRPSARLRELTLEAAGTTAAGLPAGGDVLFVNGRCVMPPAELGGLGAGCALVCAGDGGAETVIAARLSGAGARGFFEGLSLPTSVKRLACDGARVLRRAWDVIRHRDACLDADLKIVAGRIGAGGGSTDPRTGRWHIGAVLVHPSVKISPGVVLDGEGGAVVIDEGAVVRPGSIIVGPAYIGKGSTVLERALIKPHTAIGPVCKVTGEIGGTIFQGYANKGHDGHLGDSWVGEWANFGAGTTNSNLLNTYAEVIATGLVRTDTGKEGSPGGPAVPGRERTGIQYLGCIVGDHTKFAIMTRIMTGSVFGTGCMVATTAAPPTCVPAFSWLTDERAQAYRFSKFLEVARTVMGRRKAVPSEAYVTAMAALAGGSSKAANRQSSNQE